tara:strand:- start:67 stop:579 length:513 start_codon:yes stop_codon:yes gene_type:complete
MDSKKNLVLLGMMGVGKTTIGRILANKLNKRFFDIDKVIEKKNNMSIVDIFKTKGELFFRKQEEIVTLKHLEIKNSIISLGGGAFLNNKIRIKTIENCQSFWLTLNKDELEKRLKKSKKRPLLLNFNTEELNLLINKRKKFYSLANYKIKCDKLTLKKICNKVIELYENS